MRIFLLERAHERDEYNGSYTEYEVDTELGYFTSREDAQSAIDGIVGPAQKKFDAALVQYERAWKQWRTKNEELQKLGGRNAAESPRHPAHKIEVPTFDIVEIEPGRDT